MTQETVNLKHPWLVAYYQHGVEDGSEMPASYPTAAEAKEAAHEWASEVPYDDDTQHEAVIFRAVTTIRGTDMDPDYDYESLKDQGPKVPNELKAYIVAEALQNPSVKDAWDNFVLMMLLAGKDI